MIEESSLTFSVMIKGQIQVKSSTQPRIFIIIMFAITHLDNFEWSFAITEHA